MTKRCQEPGAPSRARRDGTRRHRSTRGSRRYIERPRARTRAAGRWRGRSLPISRRAMGISRRRDNVRPSPSMLSRPRSTPSTMMPSADGLMTGWPSKSTDHMTRRSGPIRPSRSGSCRGCAEARARDEAPAPRCSRTSGQQCRQRESARKCASGCACQIFTRSAIRIGRFSSMLFRAAMPVRHDIAPARESGSRMCSRRVGLAEDQIAKPRVAAAVAALGRRWTGTRTRLPKLFVR